jgi:signal transduction histidine kinase
MLYRIFLLLPALLWTIPAFSSRADSLKLAGNEKVKQGLYDEAVAVYLEALTLAEKEQNRKTAADIYNNLGIVHLNLEQYAKALEYLNKGLQLRQANGWKRDAAESYHNIGNVYYQQVEDSMAAVFYNKSLALHRETGDRSGEATVLMNLAGVYHEAGDYDKALELTLRALELRKAAGEEEKLTVVYGNLCDIMSMKSNFKSALAYADTGIANAKRHLAKRDLMLLYQTKANTYALMNNTAAELEHFKLYTAYKDSVLSEKNNNHVNELVAKYETRQKEDQIRMQAAEIGKQKTEKMFLGAVMLLLVVTGGWLFNRHKLRTRNLLQEERMNQEKQLLQSSIRAQEDERKRIALELHDGLGQMLSAARLNIASLPASGNQAYSSALSLIDDSCRELRDISHDMMPALLVKTGLVAAVHELAAKTSTGTSLTVYVDDGGLTNRLPQEKEVHLFRIIQELLNNIIKYASATEVHIQFLPDVDKLSVMIEDNGSGFDKNKLETSKGNGWFNIRSRLELIGGEIEIDSRPGKGTVVHISA